MPRFVVLEHDHPVLHWDLMLEVGNSLRTWRLERPPQSDVVIEAVALPNHRLAYLDYEGTVSGNRGTVQRWDAGTFAGLVENTDRVEFTIIGERVHGEVEMRRSGWERWTFVWKNGGEQSS